MALVVFVIAFKAFIISLAFLMAFIELGADAVAFPAFVKNDYPRECLFMRGEYSWE